MALTGQLSDMSLAELIELFCNQRKTGRLKVDYHRGHGVFFIKDGELVDAKVGALSGPEAVYFALTLPNAAFDFSPEFQPTRRTIEDKWTQVVLEGLRRLDEGSSPTEADAFGGWTPSEAEMALFKDHVDRLGENAAQQNKAKGAKLKETAEESAAAAAAAPAPLSMMVEGATGEGAGKKKWMVAGAVACVVVAITVAAIPLSGRFSGKPESAAPVEAATAQPAGAEQNSSAGEQSTLAGGTEAAPSAESLTAEPGAATEDALAAQRAREQRLREQRERERRLEEQAKKNESAAQPTGATPSPAPSATAGPKSVRVQINYDESGRVTAASVAGSSPGAEAYAGTAVRIARGKRFPAGKAGSTIVTIPVN